MAAWLFVVGERDALTWVLSHKVMAFRDHLAAGRIQVGDRFALYVTRGAFHSPGKDRAQVLATGKVVTGLSNLPINIMDEEFRQSISLEWDRPPLPPRHGLEFGPLVRQLSFIRKPDTWFAYVRKALVPVSDADIDVLHSALKSYETDLS